MADERRPCPICGSVETHCNRGGTVLQHALWRFWGRGAALGASAAALCAIMVNVFMLDAGDIAPEMAVAQTALALLVALAGWVLYIYGRGLGKRPLRCRCLLCGHDWSERHTP